MSPFTIIITLGVVATVYVLHRRALARPLASIGERRDRTRELSNDTRTLLDRVESTTAQLLGSLAPSSPLSEPLRSVERLSRQDHRPRSWASTQATKESLQSIWAILLTSPAYLHPWREYRTAQLRLDQAIWQLIQIQHVIGMDDSQRELQPIIDLIHEYKWKVVENSAMGLCRNCERGQEHQCTRPVERPDDSSVPFLSCWQQKLLAATRPQERDWAFDLLKTSK